MYWVLLDGNRWLVAVGGASVTFIVLLVLGVVDDPPIRLLMRTSDEVKTTAQAYLTALVTGVTIVVAISQVVISQELGSLGEQRERMAGVMEFRQDVEERFFESAAPAEPVTFLRMLVDATVERSHELRAAVATNDADDLREKIRQFDEGLTEQASDVTERLNRTPFGRFTVIRTALEYNYSWKIYELRRIRFQHRDALGRNEKRAFDEMVSVLALYAPARENFKTLYFRRDLTRLSRAMIYTAIPGLVLSLVVSLYLDANDFPGAFLGVDNMVWLVSAAFTVGLLPFFLLASYVIRIASVAELTLAIGPFILRESERERDVHCDDTDDSAGDTDEQPVDVAER